MDDVKVKWGEDVGRGGGDSKEEAHLCVFGGGGEMVTG